MSLFQMQPDPLKQLLTKVNPRNTLVLCNVPSGIKVDHLILFLESNCGLEESEFNLHHLKESPLILMTLMDSVKGEQIEYQLILSYIWISFRTARHICEWI